MANPFTLSTRIKNQISIAQQRQIRNRFYQWASELEHEALKYEYMNTESSVIRAIEIRRLQENIRNEARNIYADIQQNAINNMLLVVNSVTNDSIKMLVDSGFLDEFVLRGAFHSVNINVIQSIITGSVYQGNWDLSRAIWGHERKTRDILLRIVAEGITKNQDLYTIAKNLEAYVNPRKRTPWNFTSSDGKRIFRGKVDFNAQRLARTLLQHSYQKSFQEQTLHNPFVIKYRWLANGSRACELCIEMNGKLFEKEKLPLDHPNGMCTMEPVLDEGWIDKLGDWIISPVGTYSDIDEFVKKIIENKL
jgi:hypothetical protein